LILSLGLGLGWPAAFGCVVGPSPIVWSVSALLTSPFSALMWFSASLSALVSVLVLASALGLGLVLVSALALT
jgi:hypothetical protein